MKVEVSTVQKIRLSEIELLDDVTITLDDQGVGRGGITIACYGKSWTSWWGGMGKQRIAEFFTSCSGDYLADKLATLDAKVTDYSAISETLGYCVDATTLMLCTNDLARVYGSDWHADLPQRDNPDYLYLRRIIKATQDGLRQLA